MNNIILIGFQHVGKTSVGKLLAQRLKKNFFDTDELIEEQYANVIPSTARDLPQLSMRYQELPRCARDDKVRISVSNIYRCHGEPYFRELETQTIADLKNTTASIIAVGGGSVMNEANAKQLKQLGKVVYLSLAYAALCARNAAKPTPAFLEKTTFAQLYTAREPVYQQLADIQCSTDLLSVTEVTEKLILLLNEE